MRWGWVSQRCRCSSGGRSPRPTFLWTCPEQLQRRPPGLGTGQAGAWYLLRAGSSLLSPALFGCRLHPNSHQALLSADSDPKTTGTLIDTAVPHRDRVGAQGLCDSITSLSPAGLGPPTGGAKYRGVGISSRGSAGGWGPQEAKLVDRPLSMASSGTHSQVLPLLVGAQDSPRHLACSPPTDRAPAPSTPTADRVRRCLLPTGFMLPDLPLEMRTLAVSRVSLCAPLPSWQAALAGMERSCQQRGEGCH